VDPETLDLRQVAEVSRFRADELSASYARLRCGLNWWSFGERIEIHLNSMDDSALVDVSSCCSSPTQLEDWGKNAKNVRRVFEAIETQLPPGVMGEAVPCCSRCGYLLAGLEDKACPECGASDGRVSKAGATFARKLRRAAILGAVLTGIELLVLTVLTLLNVLPAVFTVFGGLRGAAFLACLNALVLFGLLLLARVWRPNG
jgi:hypothetical protein